ncbi:UNVERIFIED_CONTAM: hypothetical protein FKN15_017667 [Acipenser sinensis]
MGLPEPEPEPTELDLLIQNRKPMKVPLSAVPSPAEEQDGLPPVTEQELSLGKELLPEGKQGEPSAETEEELVRQPLPQPQPPPLQASPVLPSVVPSHGIMDTLPECPDLPPLVLVPWSQHRQAQLCTSPLLHSPWNLRHNIVAVRRHIHSSFLPLCSP